MKRHARPLPWMLLACCLYASAADTPPRLRHDPFMQPDTPRATSAAAAAAAASALPDAPPWQPRLSAVLVGGDQPLAVVDGSIVGIGQEVAGHRLVRVAERTATFVRLGVTIEIKMDSARAAVR